MRQWWGQLLRRLAWLRKQGALVARLLPRRRRQLVTLPWKMQKEQIGTRVEIQQLKQVPPKERLRWKKNQPRKRPVMKK